MVPQKQFERPANIMELAARLSALGYYPVPIPLGSKGPTITGWDKLRLKPDEIPAYFKDAGLVGCLHANLACFDIDVTDPALADEIVAEGFKRFPQALERIGRAPKSAIVLRMDEPGFKVHNTEKHGRVSDDGEAFEAQVEVRTLTRQMVVYGVHPDTQKPYRWPRGELWATPRDELPAIGQAAAQDFRDWCNKRIREWSGAEKPSAIVIDIGDHRLPLIARDERMTEAGFLKALSYVPPSLGHESGWRETLMGIHDYFAGSARGLDVAKDWSSADPRYSPQEVEAKWRSFEVGKGVGYRSVLHYAKQNGCDLSAIAKAERPQSQPEHNPFKEMTEAEIDAIPPALFRPWKRIDLTTIPYPKFVYSDFYARGYTSVTLAPPKVGKSMLGLAEAIDIATGRGILTGVEREPQKVVYYNAEDDQHVIDSRVAALLVEYDIGQDEIEDRLFATSGVDRDDFYMVSGLEGVINEPLFISIEKFIAETGADALIFDPLQDLSRSPETNEVFRLLGQRMRRMAAATGVALGLIHHTRKIAPGTTPTIDDGRGGSALRGTARFNRILIGMSEDEAAKSGVQNHRHYFRIGDMESNLAPPSAEVNRWFEKASIITPNGHSVGAIRPWTWPDAFDGISPADAGRVRSIFAGMAEPPRADIRSPKWAGLTIAQILGMDPKSASGKSKARTLLGKWIETDVLRVVQGHDNRAGRPVDVVIAGDNNPATEVRS